jgi:hypothetical protein
MHGIQDIILAIGSFVIVLAVIPSVISDRKPALLTSLPTSVVLFVFAGVYFSLQLWFTSVMAAITAGLWMVLAIQKARQKKKKQTKK